MIVIVSEFSGGIQNNPHCLYLSLSLYYYVISNFD